MPDIAIGPSTGSAASPSCVRSFPARDASVASRPPVDRLDLSEHARHLERLRSMPSVRTEKVESIRASIERGTYDTPERMQAALMRLLHELAG